MDRIKNFLFVNTSSKQTIAKNTIWLVVGEMVSRFLRFFVVVYAARVLGAEGWGVFSYALGIGGLLMIFSDFGLSAYITRELTQGKENHQQLVSTAFFIKISVLIISTILVIILGPFIATVKEAAPILYLIAFILFFDSLREFGLAFNRAFEKMEWEAFAKIITSLIILIAGLILIHHHPEPKSLAITYFLGSSIGCIILLIIIRKRILFEIKYFKWNLIGYISAITFSFAFTSLIGSIMANTDLYMLGLWRTPEEIGYYAAGQRLYQFILVVPSIISMAIFPALARLETDRDKFAALLQKAIVTALIIGIPIAFGGIVFAKDIILLILGPGYFPAIKIFQAFNLMILVAFPSMILSNAIFARNEQKVLVKASSIGACINILLNVFLIRMYGALGSAIATLISLCIVTLLIGFRIKRVTGFTIAGTLTKPFLAGLLMFLVCFLGNVLHIYFIYTVLFAAVFYFLTLLLLRDPTLSEIKDVFFIKK
jgi:O-antigen/teichoic acid export membrane protein